MFEQASRLKLRFTTAKGQVTAEDLWDLPLSSKTGAPNLDAIAINLHKQVKSDEDVSFVTRPPVKDVANELRFTIVKHVIEIRMAENQATRDELERKAKKQRIRELIGKKEDEAFEGLSVEELQAMLEAD